MRPSTKVVATGLFLVVEVPQDMVRVASNWDEQLVVGSYSQGLNRRKICRQVATPPQSPQEPLQSPNYLFELLFGDLAKFSPASAIYFSSIKFLLATKGIIGHTRSNYAILRVYTVEELWRDSILKVRFWLVRRMGQIFVTILAGVCSK